MIHEDRWLSGLFCYPVYRIDTHGDPAAIASTLTEHVRDQQRAFYYTKVGTEQIEVVRQLSAAGMYVVDVNTTFRRSPAAPFTLPTSDDITVGTLRAEDTEAVLDIAGSCFRYSRFHLDPLVPRDLANTIKREWIRNYALGVRGDSLLIASHQGQPVGFLAAIASESSGQQFRTIDLIGVHNDFQHRGVGSALIRAFVERYAGHCDVLQVGTQAANIPSMRLYEKCGFGMANTTYVLHMHIG